MTEKQEMPGIKYYLPGRQQFTIPPDDDGSLTFTNDVLTVTHSTGPKVGVWKAWTDPGANSGTVKLNFAPENAGDDIGFTLLQGNSQTVTFRLGPGGSMNAIFDVPNPGVTETWTIDVEPRDGANPDRIKVVILGP